MRLKLLSLIAVLTTAALLVGCGKGENDAAVVGAIAASSQVKTRAFSGTMTMGSGAQSIDFKFEGAVDTRDADRPKVRFAMTGSGNDTTMVAPGDGKFYFTSPAGSYYTDLPKSSRDAARQSIDPSAVFKALEGAVGSFSEAQQPLKDAGGKTVSTMTAYISKDKLCGSVLDSLGSALSGFGGGVGAMKFDGDGLGSFCKSMLKTDPQIWIGITAGRATDVALSAKIDMMGMGASKVEVTYHEFDQDKDQTGFDAPKNAKPMPSLDQLGGSTASVSGAGFSAS